MHFQNHNSTIKVLDSLRAFAALSVCLYHFVCTTTGYILDEIILSFFSFGTYGVQMFFVISGFVIPWSMFNSKFKFRNIFTFLLKRLVRLEPPYIISIIFALVILFLRNYFLATHNQINVHLTQVVFHLGYLIPFCYDYKWLNDVYWTLAIEFQYYFFIAIMFIPLLQLNLLFRILLYITLISFSFIGNYEFLPFWLPVFLLGFLTFLYFANHITNYEYYISLIVLIVFCLFKYTVASVVFSLIPVFCLIFYRDVQIYGLHFLGKFSYSIYLVHSLIGSSFINIMSHYYSSPIAKFLIIVGGLMFSLIGAYIMYYLIEKPSKSWSSKIKYNN